jgi:hypothetical protein
VADGVSSPHRDAHEYALRYMKQYHRANVITSEQAIAQFRNDPEAEQTSPAPGTSQFSYADWPLASRA